VIVFIFFIISIFLSFITTSLALRPVNLLAKEVKERGPHDLQEVKYPSPKELKPLLNSLNGFIKRLQNSLKKTEIFIAEAAHHIKTPLTVVKSESELALRKSKTPENRVHLRNIIRSVDQTSRSSIQLLEHAMVMYRAEKKQRELCKVNQIIKKIADNYKPAANLRDINIKLNLLTDYNIEILLDRILLEVTLRNLIDNAIKYSPIEENIIIKSIINNNKYIILIENVSLKMDKINKNQLVKRFSRGKNHKNIIGTGLGLAIVTEAVHALKGKFNIKIENKKKLITSILLPLK
jgi:two-component system sensor histidine kinase TctE